MVFMIDAVSVDINHTDTIMRVQHGDGVAWADLQPLFQITTGMIEYGMQYQGRQSEIIDTVHMAGNFDLPEEVGMDLNEHFNVKFGRLPCKVFNKSERFGDHETSTARFFNGISNGIQT